MAEEDGSDGESDASAGPTTGKRKNTSHSKSATHKPKKSSKSKKHKRSKHRTAEESDSEESSSTPESEDDQDTVQKTFPTTIRPVLSANVHQPSSKNLCTVSLTSSSQPTPTLLSTNSSIRLSSPLPWSSPPPSSDPVGALLHEGPPFHNNYQSGGKPAIGDYSEDAQLLIQRVINEYEVRICTVAAFPSEKTSIGWMHMVWTQICLHGSHIHSQVITTVHLLIQSHYGFTSTGNTSSVSKNRQLSEMLLMKSAFHYKKPDKHKGFCQNGIILTVIHTVWFNGHNVDGNVFPVYYDPIPLECLALILTALSFGLEEWSTGTRKQASFMEKVVETKYDTHLEDLRSWSNLDTIITKNMHKKLYEHAHAGMADDQQANAPQLTGDLLESAWSELRGHTGETDTKDKSHDPGNAA
ncbi:hypothetical protein BDQ17DRAFT_1328958 [Cyathus striatus]|nr:hypothetical protein BDQ17DRAFT_1328958 [Cyathus striatus]